MLKIIGLFDAPAFRKNDNNSEVIGFSINKGADGSFNQKID